MPINQLGRIKTENFNECESRASKGKFIEPTVYARRYKAILKEIGVRDVKFHTTRHTFSTRALEIGMDIKTLSEILGHASPTVTLNIYAHSLPEHKAKEMDRLGKMYNPS